jgi:hypothetical protein
VVRKGALTLLYGIRSKGSAVCRTALRRLSVTLIPPDDSNLSHKSSPSFPSLIRRYSHPEVRSRTHTEEHARDSLENLFFPVCRFRELTGHYPEAITVISYDFKRQRFVDLHREALQFPKERFGFVGTPAPDPEKAGQGEAVTLSQFRTDMYGCRGILLEKKLRRNPFAVSIPYTDTCPEMADLLAYCGDKPYGGPLPWRQRTGGRRGGPGV